MRPPASLAGNKAPLILGHLLLKTTATSRSCLTEGGNLARGKFGTSFQGPPSTTGLRTPPRTLGPVLVNWPSSPVLGFQTNTIALIGKPSVQLRSEALNIHPHICRHMQKQFLFIACHRCEKSLVKTLTTITRKFIHHYGM